MEEEGWGGGRKGGGGGGGGREGREGGRREKEERRRVDKGKVADKHYPAMAMQGILTLFRSMSQHLLDM